VSLRERERVTDRAAAPAHAHAPTPGERPLLLAPNRIDRFYAGGARIDALRSAVAPAAAGPEEWVGSITTSFGETTEGLSRLEDGRFLRDVLAAEPVAFLGPQHVRRWGASSALLVKLLDAGERLPVHFHPGRAFARDALGLEFGKTEAWVILDAAPGAVVHLGLREPAAPGTVATWLAEQDTEAMLGALHELPARPGDVFFVPAGTLHAIGAGILMVELQEPTDLSILLEWERLGVGPDAAHLGLGWERALAAVDRDPVSPQAVWVHDGAGPDTGEVVELLPISAAPYFRAQRIATDGEPVDLDPSFAVLVVVDGAPSLWTQAGDRVELVRGHAVVVPYGAGATTIDGHGRIIRCLPPLADAGDGRW